MYETFPNIQEERELLPEIFSVSSLCSKRENDDFNFNLSNTDEANNNSHQKSPSNSIVFRLNNLEKLLDQELSQSQEDPIKVGGETLEKQDQVKEITVEMTLMANFSEGRLSKMSEKEAAMRYEQRRKELFKGFAQGKPLEPRTKGSFSTQNIQSLKEFVVYNPNPKKGLKKSSSQNKKPEKAAVLKEKSSARKPSERPGKQLGKSNSRDNLAFFGKSTKKIPEIPSQKSSAAKTLQSTTCLLPRKPNTQKKSKTVVEKGPKVLTIDLRKMKKQMSSGAIEEPKSEDREKSKRKLKLSKLSKNCSVIIEEETVKEEAQNRSRSFSFTSYMNTTTEKPELLC